jgi:hypothetical protein
MVWLSFFLFLVKEFTMVSKIAAVLFLATLAGAASASDDRRGIDMYRFRPTEVSVIAKTPEIDPASAMAGLTLLAGGLAVLRGRRSTKSAE